MSMCVCVHVCVSASQTWRFRAFALLIARMLCGQHVGEHN